MLLNNQQITGEIKKENLHRNEWKWKHNNAKSMGFSVKEVLRGRFIAILTYLMKQGNQINNLTLHLKQLEKEEMKNPRVSRRKEIIKIEQK